MRRLPHGAILVGALACASATSARAESAPMGQSWSLALEGCQMVPVTDTPAYGSALLRKPFSFGTPLQYSLSFDGLHGALTAAHLHGPAPRGQVGPIVATLIAANPSQGDVALTDEQPQALYGGQYYLDLHSEGFPDGELRAQVDYLGSPCAPPVDAGVADALSGIPDAADVAPDRGGGCAAGGGGAGAGAGALIALGALVARRRRR